MIMAQIKVSLNEEIVEFVFNHQKYGYSSKSEIVKDALTNLKKNLETNALIESAEIYQELYDNDLDLQELTDSAASSCLE
jgi:Arc/MetJ-type ribon-helix-helix transcriptional regulator